MAIARLAAYDEFVEFITSNPTLAQIRQFRHELLSPLESLQGLTDFSRSLGF
jgi:hypothetical protein